MRIGQKLTIFAENKQVLWVGTLKTKYHGFLNLKTIEPFQANWHPDDVLEETWCGWFRQTPSLKAELEI